MAKRFRFRLQTLLEVRQLYEREAKRLVGEKSAEIARIDRLNRQTVDEITRQQDDLLRAQESGSVDAVGLARGRAWIAHLRKTIAARHTEKAARNEELGELQAKLRDARTQTRIIEKLRERRWDAHRRDTDRREQAESDELARQLLDFEQV